MEGAVFEVDGLTYWAWAAAVAGAGSPEGTCPTCSCGGRGSDGDEALDLAVMGLTGAASSGVAPGGDAVGVRATADWASCKNGTMSSIWTC